MRRAPGEPRSFGRRAGCGTLVGCFTAIVSPQGELIGEPLRSGEGVVSADLDFSSIDRRKRLMDSRGLSSRPELLSLLIDRTPAAHVHESNRHPTPVPVEPQQVPGEWQ